MRIPITEELVMDMCIGGKMKRFEHYVILKDTMTGETRAIQATHNGELLHEGTEFMWSEGNYSCDCNRADFFYGRDANGECGNSRFRIVATNIPDLRVEEEDEPTVRFPYPILKVKKEDSSPPLTSFEEKRDGDS